MKRKAQAAAHPASSADPRLQGATLASRQSILELLSDEEVARVSTAETAPGLAEGEEYLDLEQPARGVLRAKGSPTTMGAVLPRKAVLEATWGRILGLLALPVASPA
jgi:hypothetical protein